MGYITVIARVVRDLWQRKQTLSSGFALGLGSFTATNPWPRAITITYDILLCSLIPCGGVGGGYPPFPTPLYEILIATLDAS